ncbi:hypothetical protein WSM22_21490 [Cytophagales bacterium WSM2-2]|nr:hypothetical protein WSM22_21490 [Cytophagales bacterium WSM2-2]
MIMDWYKNHGYNFLALSDHNILATGEKWIKISKSKLYEDGFQNYLNKYGKEWVTYKTDSGRFHVRLKTLDEYRPRFEDQKFLIIRSEEITDRYQGKPIHMNATNVEKLIPPQGGTSIADVIQRNIDAVLQQRKETSTPMFPHVNHPNFYYTVSVQDMISLRGERFFEVYNGHPLVHNDGDSLHPSTEKMWDMINIEYAKRGQSLMFGLATDDSHNYHQFGGSFANAGRGWVMVNSESLTPASLIKALEAGDFYSSTGVELIEIKKDKKILSIKVKTEPGVTYQIHFIGVKEKTDKAVELKLVSGVEGSFNLSPDILYVRAKIISNKLKINPFKEGEFEVAWTQPVSVK